MKKTPLLLGILWVAPCLLVACGPSPETRDDEAGGTPREVTVERRDISASVRATGIIKPMVGAEVRVGSRISGVVQRLYTEVGNPVEEGDLLAQLDATELRARSDQALAAVNMARAEFDYAESDLARKRELVASKVAPRIELEVAENAHRVAELRVSEAEANLAYARTQLGYARVLAPISGVVASVTTQEGETVAASFTTPTFVTIIDLNRLELWAYVDETDIGRVEEGQPASFTVDTYPDTDFQGTVQSVYPDAVIENTVVNYITIISIGDRQGKTLRPEMTANVTLFLETRENVLAVPRRALRRDRGRYLVSVVREGQIEEQEVQVGWRDDQYTEIMRGLEDGDVVLIEG
ncbi:MAG: efflux RND transporter periplasmic adaptor subunit [Gemmatimonadetes bacterium]|nr:efflux RND transporter periplasmic adaptor subunit [Gemmatimonadota bacterium]NNM04250.1 efflux RND transporter periplasmic adaptor subunit [Gemmatimonadota bacterium]